MFINRSIKPGSQPRALSLHDKLRSMEEEFSTGKHSCIEGKAGNNNEQRSKTSINHHQNDQQNDYLSPPTATMPSVKRRASESAAVDKKSQEQAPVRSPKSPQTVLKYYKQFLSQYEQQEVAKYDQIYFMGPHAKKINGRPENPILNYGYDDDRGDYHLVMQDHLAYRYEVLDPLGQGSFGQVVKCLDHKTGQTVAIKLIRNKKRFHAQAATEVKILKDLVRWVS